MGDVRSRCEGLPCPHAILPPPPPPITIRRMHAHPGLILYLSPLLASPAILPPLWTLLHPPCAPKVVVCTTASQAEAQRVDDICASQPGGAVPFIWARTAGVFASVFCDFGPSFTVVDVDGEGAVRGNGDRQWGSGTRAAHASCTRSQAGR